MCRAMILAAGRGERLRPFTDHTPKPLLPVGGQPLIVWHLQRLAAANIRNIVINTAWLGEQLPATLGDGSQFGVKIQYSHEGKTGLETAGGIATALPFLGHEPFIVLNGDVLCDYPLAKLKTTARTLNPSQTLAHLILVDNPTHHPNGDFSLNAAQRVQNTPQYTFSGLGAYHPALFANIAAHQHAALAPILRTAMTQHLISGEHYAGSWLDVGTPERLELAQNWVHA